MRLLLIFLIPIFIWAESAIDFNTFKQIVLKESFVLKESQLNMKIYKKEKDIFLRYKNPILEIEKSRYDSEINIKNGYRGAINQPVRLFGVKEDMEVYSNSKIYLSEAVYKKKRALFLKELEKAYINYVYKKRLYELIKEELEIAKKVVSVTKERHTNGTVTKARYLQASLEAAQIENSVFLYENELFLAYQKLLQIAGIKKKFILKDFFLYDFDSSKTKNLQSPDIKIALLKKRFYLAEAKMKSRLLKEIELFAEYEKESEQKIARFGISFELPLFNIRKEEEQISRIKSLQSSFEMEYVKNSQTTQINALKETLANLKKLFSRQKELLKKESQLLELFKEGYAVSKGSLIELLDAKNRLLRTKKEMLSLLKKCNDYTIELNYLQGYYNE